MGEKPVRPPSLAADVITELKSCATVTERTAPNLRSLLGMEKKEYSITTAPRRLQATDPATIQDVKPKTSVRTRKPSNRKATPQVAILEVAESAKITPNAISRRRIATEAFNAALRCLSEAAKEKRILNDGMERSDSNQKVPQPRRPAIPLEQQSPNRKIRSLPPSHTVRKADSFATLAQCAVVALSYLEDENDSDAKPAPQGLQHAQGALMLLDKLITLQLQDEASAQAICIHNQIQRRNSLLPVQSHKTAKLSLADIISISTTNLPKAEFDLVISFQSQLLRLAILSGSDCKFDVLVENVSLTTSGSPPFNILAGIETGLLTSEKAGFQLRTVAQAMMKIQSVFIATATHSLKTTQIYLTSTIYMLMIRCRSWQLLQHQARLDEEFWPYLTRVLKRFTTIKSGLSSETYAFVLRETEALRAMIKQCSFSTSFPASVAQYLVDIAELCGCYDQAILWLDQQREAASHDHIECVIISWRRAILCYKDSPRVNGMLLRYLKEAEKSLRVVASMGITSTRDRLLLYSVRLRKVALTMINDITLDAGSKATPDLRGQMQKHSLQILRGLVKLSSQFMEMEVTETQDQQRGAQDTISRSSNTLTNVAKSVEALLEAVSYLIEKSTTFHKVCEEGMLECEVIMNLLCQKSYQCDDAPLMAFVGSLSKRLSNLLWSYYIANEDKDPKKSQSLSLVSRSIAVLLHLDPEIQYAGLLGAKLERKALIELQMKNPEQARSSFEAAINYHISLGALRDATTSALSNKYKDVWTCHETKQYALKQTLKSHLKIGLTYQLVCVPTGSWVFDDINLLADQRCILLEAQILDSAGQNFSTSQSDALLKAIDTVLELSADSQLQVYRARFALNVLQISSKFPDFPRSTTLETIIHSSKMCVSPLASSVYLSSYAGWFETALALQWSISNGKGDFQEVANQAQLLCALIMRIHDSAALTTIVEDEIYCLGQLELMISYAQLSGSIGLQLSCLLACQHLFQLMGPMSRPQLLDNLSRIGSLYSQLGMTHRAKDIFTAAARLLSDVKEPCTSKIRFGLEYAEHLINTDNLDPAATTLNQASKQFNATYTESITVVDQRRLEKDSLIARSAVVASQLAFRSGNLAQANQFSRQAVKISAGVWHVVEKHRTTEKPQRTGQSKTSTMQDLTIDISNLSISLRQINNSGALTTISTNFLEYATLHQQALFNIGTLSIHNGSYQDAAYYFEQMLKLSMVIGSRSVKFQALSFLSALNPDNDHIQKAIESFQAFQQSRSDSCIFEEKLSALILLDTLIQAGRCEDAQECLRRTAIFLSNDKLEKICGGTFINTTNPESDREVCRSSKAAPRHPARRKTPDQKKTGSNPSISLSDYRNKIITEKLHSTKMLLLDSSTTNTEIESAAASHHVDMADPSLPEHKNVNVRMMLKQALQKLSSDAVKCVLAETAVALPVRYQPRRKNGRVSFAQACNLPGNKKSTTSRKKKIEDQPSSGSVNLNDGEQILSNAQIFLPKFRDQISSQYATHDLHYAGKLRSKLSLYASATAIPFSTSSSEVVLQSLESKDVVLQRTAIVTRAELMTRDKEQILTWPSVSLDGSKTNNGGDTIDSMMSEMRNLPKTWTVLSLALSDDQTELIISKMNSHASPFVLRIPLSRSDLELGHDEDFTFHRAKLELMTIISKANKSCHDRRGQGDRGQRQAWYKERQILDQQLGEWLYNIENIWLGGFRGIVSRHHFSDEIRSFLERSLNKALDNHLPSRRKQTKGSHDQIELHLNVVELFLGLGSPGDADLDDAVVDLLYFVVDILQFGGEHNAYDEIDFDALAVDIIDALTSCHENMADEIVDAEGHTILILDKELESFPWEALPCLEHHSISRMPSLSSVIQRLKVMRSQDVNARGFTITDATGAYLLNPASDLASTESTFEPILKSNLPSFKSSIRTPPSEIEFESMLSEHDLLLYFGHGSGAQYIRGRTIRAMDKCAVALLMGCSSAKMTECGKLESYGMPGYYIGGLSNSMAMVGTLWDVTDRDIDRFAIKLMLEWGLIVQDEHVDKVLERKSTTAAKSKGQGQNKNKGKSKGTTSKSKLEVETEAETEIEVKKKGTVSLDEAVKNAREACLLRYLNGAAPVMYGIPVFLR